MSDSAGRASGGARRVGVHLPILAWSIVPLTALLVSRRVGSVELLSSAIVAAGVVLLASRNPGRALVALVIFLPSQLFAFSQLYAWGVPAGLLRPLGATKEAMGLAVVVAGVREFRRSRRRLDLLDGLALSYLAIVAAYFAFPRFFAPFAPLELQTRVLGLRVDAGFALLLLAARHAPVTPAQLRAIRAAVVAMGLMVAAVGIYQWAQPDAWLRYVQDTAQVPRFQIEVLGASPSDVLSGLNHLRERPVRVGSTFLGTFQMADYLLIAVGLGLESAVRRKGSRVFVLTACASVLVIYLAQGRANVLAVIVMALIALRPAVGRIERGRVRLLLGMVAVALIALPFIGTTRYAGGFGASSSSVQHGNEFEGGVDALFQRPLGSGLGSSPGIGQRFDVPGTVTSDNTLLQVGNELGFVAMVLYMSLLVVMLQRLSLAVRGNPDDSTAAAGRLALIGLLTAGMFHHAFVELSVSWTFFALCGLAIGSAERNSRVGTRFDKPADQGAGDIGLWSRARISPA